MKRLHELKELRTMVEDLRGIVSLGHSFQGQSPGRVDPMSGSQMKSDPEYLQLKTILSSLTNSPAIGGLDSDELRALNTLYITVFQMEKMDVGAAISHLKAVWTSEAHNASAKLPVGPDIVRAVETLLAQNG